MMPHASAPTGATFCMLLFTALLPSGNCGLFDPLTNVYEAVTHVFPNPNPIVPSGPLISLYAPHGAVPTDTDSAISTFSTLNERQSKPNRQVFQTERRLEIFHDFQLPFRNLSRIDSQFIPKQTAPKDLSEFLPSCPDGKIRKILIQPLIPEIGEQLFCFHHCLLPSFRNVRCHCTMSVDSSKQHAYKHSHTQYDVCDFVSAPIPDEPGSVYQVPEQTHVAFIEKRAIPAKKRHLYASRSYSDSSSGKPRFPWRNLLKSSSARWKKPDIKASSRIYTDDLLITLDIEVTEDSYFYDLLPIFFIYVAHFLFIFIHHNTALLGNKKDSPYLPFTLLYSVIVSLLCFTLLSSDMLSCVIYFIILLSILSTPTNPNQNPVMLITSINIFILILFSYFSYTYLAYISSLFAIISAFHSLYCLNHSASHTQDSFRTLFSFIVSILSLYIVAAFLLQATIVSTPSLIPFVTALTWFHKTINALFSHSTLYHSSYTSAVQLIAYIDSFVPVRQDIGSLSVAITQLTVYLAVSSFIVICTTRQYDLYSEEYKQAPLHVRVFILASSFANSLVTTFTRLLFRPKTFVIHLAFILTSLLFLLFCAQDLLLILFLFSALSFIPSFQQYYLISSHKVKNELQQLLHSDPNYLPDRTPPLSTSDLQKLIRCTVQIQVPNRNQPHQLSIGNALFCKEFLITVDHIGCPSKGDFIFANNHKLNITNKKRLVQFHPHEQDIFQHDSSIELSTRGFQPNFDQILNYQSTNFPSQAILCGYSPSNKRFLFANQFEFSEAHPEIIMYNSSSRPADSGTPIFIAIDEHTSPQLLAIHSQSMTSKQGWSFGILNPDLVKLRRTQLGLDPSNRTESKQQRRSCSSSSLQDIPELEPVSQHSDSHSFVRPHDESEKPPFITSTLFSHESKPKTSTRSKPSAFNQLKHRLKNTTLTSARIQPEPSLLTALCPSLEQNPFYSFSGDRTYETPDASSLSLLSAALVACSHAPNDKRIWVEHCSKLSGNPRNIITTIQCYISEHCSALLPAPIIPVPYLTETALHGSFKTIAKILYENPYPSNPFDFDSFCTKFFATRSYKLSDFGSALSAALSEHNFKSS